MKKETKLTFEDFVGNNQAVGKVKLLSADAANNSGKLPHMGFFGPAGHGKTMLSRIVATHVDREYVYINCVAIKTPMIFRGILTHPDNNVHGAVVVLDEAHRLPGPIQDNMLSVLESPAQLVTTYRNQIIRDNLPDHISFILCTTHAGDLRDALLSRLESVEFHSYSLEEMKLIAVNYLKKKYNVPAASIDERAIEDIGRRSRSGRHIVNNVDNIMRYLKITKLNDVSLNASLEVFNILGIDKNGLTKRDKSLLTFLSRGPCGIDTLEAYLQISKKDIKDKIEPFLMRNKLMVRQSSGRAITEYGMKALRGEVIDA
jgi:Holliday junction DNA helicase RuvB